MSQPEQVSPAQLFDQFFRPTLFAPWAHALLQRAAPQAGEGVLNLACGTGTVAHMAAPLVGAEGSVAGLDINPGMLTAVRARPTPTGAAIRWQPGDAALLDLPHAALCRLRSRTVPARPPLLSRSRCSRPRGSAGAPQRWAVRPQRVAVDRAPAGV